MYKRSTVAIVSIILALLLATMFVCIDGPYSKSFWIEIGILCFAGVAFGMVNYRLYDHSDSTMPLSIVGIKLTFVYLCFVVIMALPVFIDLRLKMKYYALIHAFGAGIWMIVLLVMRMGKYAIDSSKRGQGVITCHR